MARVTNLKINLQTGSGGTYYASWDFDEGTRSASSSPSSSSGSVKVGDLVSIKSGSTYYNGVAIPSWVINDRWYVVQVKGDRAVLGKNAGGTHNIQSAVKVSNLVGGSGSSSTTSSPSPSVSNTLDHYTVKWAYDTGNNVWFSGGESDVKEKHATYSAPGNAIKIKVTVKPVSKTYQSNGKEASYWTGTSETATYSVSTNPPDTISAPNVEIKDFTLTATLDNISDSKIDQIQFQVYDGTKLFDSGTVDVKTRRAVFSCSINAGGNYRVRCRAVNWYGTSTVYGEWSDFSGESTTIPTSISGVSCIADSETSVKLTWNSVSTATSYEIQYSVKKTYFDSASEVSSLTVESSTAFVTGLEAREWFFRVRAVNDVGRSAWSEIVSVVIGATPEPPTTWSSTTTAVIGEDVTLYWVHNTEDGSKMAEAQIEIDINGASSTVTIPGITEEDKDEGIYSYTLDTSKYSVGAVVLWKVKTKGINGKYGEWSTQRTINVYAPPTLSLEISMDDNDILSSLPLTIEATAGPNEQTPTSYHVAVIANDSYEIDDAIGSSILVVEGSEVYSKIFNVSDRTLNVELSAGDILLQNDQSYTVKVSVSMNSGLTAENSLQFTTDWEDYSYIPDASVAIDKDTLSCYISPFCIDIDGSFPEDVALSVYRREYNGTFTKLASGLANDGVVTITDPHPALDYARYRIVAQHTGTSEVMYEDLPGLPIGEPAIVIQWDETWSDFNYMGEDESEERPWSGSMLRLPYNVDVSEDRSIDVSLIEYIGRKHPVSYYGTQLGETATWSTVIDKTDKETLYGLRRLSVWMGDVYVREPSGVGYWAQIKVSMSTKHLDVIIPVSFEIKRVEGGV